MSGPQSEDLRRRRAPLDLTPEEFRRLGHRAVDAMAGFLATLPSRPVTPAADRDAILARLGRRPLPESGEPLDAVLEDTQRLLVENSLLNGHPGFLAYITSSAAPVGAIADFLAASVNPNVGGWPLSPVASEIEVQTVQWIGEFLGYPAGSGGLLVSGGNMANFVGFWMARRHRLPWDVRKEGVAPSGARRPRVYVSQETHTWIQKAADLSGLGTDCIRWIPTDDGLRMDAAALRRAVEADRNAGDLPFLVVGTGGSVSTGAIDPLPAIAEIARESGLWFHVDGAYGAPAAALPEGSPDLKGLSLADSVAVDPHKWLYAALEAGCLLVRDMRLLRETFSYHPPYYPEADYSPEAPVFFHEFGPQNSRGFRALKVWMAFRQVGREGFVRMIEDDIRLTRRLHDAVLAADELEAGPTGLSVATFRYVPADLRGGGPEAEAALGELNRELLARLNAGGEYYLSNAVVRGTFLLRACVVNFRTSLDVMEALPGRVVELGRELDRERRS